MLCLVIKQDFFVDLVVRWEITLLKVVRHMSRLFLPFRKLFGFNRVEILFSNKSLLNYVC